jgi:hypothetical protein
MVVFDKVQDKVWDKGQEIQVVRPDLAIGAYDRTYAVRAPRHAGCAP